MSDFYCLTCHLPRNEPGKCPTCGFGVIRLEFNMFGHKEEDKMIIKISCENKELNKSQREELRNILQVDFQILRIKIQNINFEEDTNGKEKKD